MAADPPLGATAAEAAWRAVVGARRDDLCLLRERWPDETTEEVNAAHARLPAREAPGGRTDEALARLDAAYGGAGRAPASVRRRSEAHVEERMGQPPRAPRCLSPREEEPALVRRARRGRQSEDAPDAR
jgi:hypothetical protein